MRRFITAGLLILSAFGLLTGCGGYEESGQLPQSLAKSSVQSQSYRISFFEDGMDRSLKARDGQALSEFLQKLTLDPPGYMRLQARGMHFTEEEIFHLLEQSGLYRFSAVEVSPAAPATAEEGPVLDVELTYYTYTLEDCGAHLDRRLVDHVAWETPGFGCAVNRNRLVSLVRPGNTGPDGYLVPPLARSEAKAIATYQSLPPRPFPPAEN
ncbi:CpaD family pilus assembly lipoprotein [Sneathiella sp.]|uniref:CpaD family pilus assembly lipoprotein n=1 Tax=Sneathiella sp. TaxID=1964365 RepID=UPI00262E65A9|nr:CpaD family pilus assembly lipoprotein [Sneathiella sp.]MDF2367185.1 CpaD family pilus assembly lipoprotein [Sneathiella sp.]